MWHRLGIRTFIIYVIKGFLPGLFLLLFSLFVLWIKNLLANNGASGAVGLSNMGPMISIAAGFLTLGSLPIMGFGIIINLVRYFSVKYKLEEDVFKYNRGLISVDEVSIPYSNMEDIDFDQSVLGRIIGVARIGIVTAAEDVKGVESSVIFRTIDVEKARFLQKELLARGSVQKVQSV